MPSAEEEGTSDPGSAASEVSPAHTHAPGFWPRLRDHKVLQWGLAYLGAALAIAHGGELLGHTFHWPEIANRLLMGALIVGFPVALALAWYHGHRSLRSISAAEASIISLLVLVGAGLLILLIRVPEEPAAARVTPRPTEAEPASLKTSASTPAAQSKGPSIAVLPFVNMSADRDQEYFSDGLSEELLNQLAHLPNLRVIGRTSSFAFKGKNEDLRVIGETLGVNHILEGSVRRSGDRVRIVAQLIDPADGSHQWSDTYDRKLGDIFAIQEEIARSVAGALQLTIGAADLGEAGTRNLEAYDAFLHALTNRRAGPQPMLDRTVQLERAVALDPEFKAAWVLLVTSYGALLIGIPDRSAEWLEKQALAIQRVEELAPGSPSVRLVQAGRAVAGGRLIEAERILESTADLPTALSLEGQMQYVFFLAAVGRPKDGLKILATIRQADPLAGLPSGLTQILYETVGEYDLADAEYRRTLPFSGDNLMMLRGTALVRAMARRDVTLVKKAVADVDPNDPLGGPMTARLAPLLDDRQAALAELKRIYRDPAFVAASVPLAAVAQWAAYLGDPELSLDALRRMPRRGVGGQANAALFTLWRPVERDVRRLPAFKDLVRELGLVDYWRASGNWGEFCRPTGKGDFECT